MAVEEAEEVEAEARAAVETVTDVIEEDLTAVGLRTPILEEEEEEEAIEIETIIRREEQAHRGVQNQDLVLIIKTRTEAERTKEEVTRKSQPVQGRVIRMESILKIRILQSPAQSPSLSQSQIRDLDQGPEIKLFNDEILKYS